ncbi:MAG TPA: FtsQ-type POTRA domain-containing protein [Chthoniobacterales bacterium]
MIRKTIRRQNRRASTSRQRRQQHLLDVKVRTHKAAARRTQRLIFFFSVLIMVAAVAGGLAFGTKNATNALFLKNKDYSVKTIEVTSDGTLSREAVLRACNLSEGVNIFSVNLTDVRQKLSNLPQVEDSRLERVLPDRLVIRIQERRPVAWVVPPGTGPASINFENAYLIDRRGVLLKTKTLAPEYLGLPLIVGIETGNYSAGQALDQDEVRAALDLIRSNSEILQTRFQIQSVDVSKGYCLVVTDRQKASVTFNLDNLDWQLRRLELLLTYCEQNSRELATVNLMAERNVPATFAVAADVPPEDDPAAFEDDGSRPAASPSVRGQEDRAKGEAHSHRKTRSKGGEKTRVRRALRLARSRANG